MNEKAKVIIVHGTGGSPFENWFPWLKQELTTLGCNVIVPSFPTPKAQSLNSWQIAFKNQVGFITPNTILIGHSLGAAFILKLLEQSSQPALATYLICGFVGKLGLPKYDLLNQSFVCCDFDWLQIRKNMGHAYVINSDNDPYVPLSKGKELAEKLQAPLTVIPGAKHMNEEAGYKSFPLLLEKIKSCVLANPENGSTSSYQ